MAKEGSTISGLMDSFATAISMALQHGVPLKVLVEKFAHTRFEPSGWTGSEELGYAKSIMDYLFRWMQLRFLSGQQLDLFANLKQPTLAATPPQRSHQLRHLLHRGPSSAAVAATRGSASPSSGEPHARTPPPTSSTAKPSNTPTAPHPSRASLPTSPPAAVCHPSTEGAGPWPLTPRHSRPQRLPHRQRHAIHVQHGRRPQLQHLRQHHDPQRLLLPLHGMRLHQRLLPKIQVESRPTQFETTRLDLVVFSFGAIWHGSTLSSILI